jgi:RHS repeat-associated protein
MRSAYDALNRVVRHETPDGSVQEFTYNTANLLATLSVGSPGGAGPQPVIRSVEYNAQGQRVRVDFGNDVATEYTYAPETSRLDRLCTTRLGGAAPARLQDLRYTYDPVGNVTHVRDGAHSPIFAANQQVDPVCRYAYDAAYRLTSATGREHQALTACQHERHADGHTAFCQLPQPAANAQALGNYAETYRYDGAGNLEEVRHRVNGTVRWVRTQRYAGNSNRLESSDAGCADEQLAMTHDANGNLTALPHLPRLRWDFKDRLVEADLSRGANPNRAYYQYDASGKRVRKTVVKNGGLLIEERVYVGLFELFLRRTPARVTVRQHAVHVLDDRCRVALRLDEVDPATSTRVTASQLRYQLGDHLGSAHVEVDGGPGARILSYEEHRPYGGSAYLAGEREAEVRRKRHRYTGQECDEESGLYYFGARYYAPWLARWLSPDPGGPQDGPNLYQAFRSSPVVYVDRDGRQTDDEIDMIEVRREAKQHAAAAKAMEQVGKTQEAIDEARSAARELLESAKTLQGHVVAHAGALKDEDFDQSELERLQQDARAKERKLEEALERVQAEMKKAEKLSKKVKPKSELVEAARAEQARSLEREVTEVRKRAREIQRETGELVRQAVEKKSKGGKGSGGGGSGSGPHGGAGTPPVNSAKGKLGEFSKAMAELFLKKGGKLVPIVGTGVGVAAVGAELSEGNYARAFVEAAGASEIPIVAQVADVGGLTADAGWIVKDYLLDPEGKAEQWYYEHVNW